MSEGPRVRIRPALGAAALVGLVVFTATSSSAQAPATQPAKSVTFEPMRLPDGHPDMQGLWLKSAGGYFGLFVGSLDGTNFAAPPGGERGRGRGLGGFPPPQYEYTPEAAKEKQYRQTHPYEDPEAHCHLPGVPRGLEQPAGLYPVQIIQDEKYFALLHEYPHDARIIPTDAGAHPKNYWAWEGDSRGRWDGDTFVVDVTNFNGRTWLDMEGNFVDENEHVIERFTLVDADTILYEATIIDPTVFARPVQERFTLKRVPKEQQMLEYSCVEGERSLQHYTDEDGGKKRRAK